DTRMIRYRSLSSQNIIIYTPSTVNLHGNLDGCLVLGDLGGGGLLRLARHVISGNLVSVDMATADHLSYEEPEDNFEGDSGVNHGFLKSEVLVRLGLDE
ncbi:hypothetical protein PENTCL1PPCAC_28395, partial [Pristionchus entomophagus]